MTVLSTLVARDVRLSFLRGAGGMTVLAFFAVVVCLFPFALGADANLLRRAAPGVIWICAVLASLLSLENIYHRDDDDGTFELLLLSPVSPVLVVCAKMIAHWLSAGMALTFAGMVVSQMLFVPVAVLPVFAASMLLGTAYMSLLGGMGAVLTFGARRPGVLLAVLVLPLYVPMLILGMGAMEAAMGGFAVRPYLLLQLALMLAALPLAPMVAAACLKLKGTKV